MEYKDKEVKKKESTDSTPPQKDKLQLSNDKIVVVKDGKEIEFKIYEL